MNHLLSKRSSPFTSTNRNRFLTTRAAGDLLEAVVLRVLGRATDPRHPVTAIRDRILPAATPAHLPTPLVHPPVETDDYVPLSVLMFREEMRKKEEYMMMRKEEERMREMLRWEGKWKIPT